MARGQGEILDDVEYAEVLTGITTGAEAPNAQPRDYLPLSKQPNSEKFRIIKGHIFADLDAHEKWRRQANEDFGFVAGEQLSEDDKAYLDEQKRPHIVFNQVLSILKAIAGMEINGRQESQFLPRENDDTSKSEVLSAASKWMADGCYAEDEQSEAFEDCCVCGVGCTESRFSYEDDSKGKYVEEEIDPREMVWDRTAKKKNLVDRRRTARIRKMPLSDGMQMFPGKNRVQLDASWAMLRDSYGEIKSYEDKLSRADDNMVDPYDDRNEITMVCFEWWEREPYWLIADDTSGEQIEATNEEYEQLKKRMAELGKALGVDMTVEAVRMTRKKFHRAWLGGEYLGGAPAPCGDRFSWNFITGNFDKKKRQWYGLIRPVRDPQMWANKFLSQVMQIMNATAKGGILAETDAFEDQRDAEETYAMPEAITWVAKDSLSGQRPKILPKPGQGDPSGYMKLLEYAWNSIPKLLGVNLELIGQQDQDQPGVVERMRKQAGMTVLATLFDSLRRFIKIVGETRLYFIQTRMSDGRLIRIVGDQYTQVVPLLRDQTTGEYDVVVAAAPTSPNQKEENWAIIQPILVLFKDQIMANPQLLVSILKYSPLPSPLVTAIEKVVTTQSNDPAQQAYQESLKQATLAKLVSESTKNQSTAEMQNAKAGATSATAAYDLAMAQNLIAKNDIEGFNHHIQAMLASAKAGTEVAKTQTERVKAVRETIGMHQDLQSGTNEAAQRQSDMTDAAVNRHIAVHDAVHNAADMHKRTALEHIKTMAGVHRDLAAANRDRVGAVVDARPEPKPAAQ